MTGMTFGICPRETCSICGVRLEWRLGLYSLGAQWFCGDCAEWMQYLGLMLRSNRAAGLWGEYRLHLYRHGLEDATGFLLAIRDRSSWSGT